MTKLRMLFGIITVGTTMIVIGSATNTINGRIGVNLSYMQVIGIGIILTGIIAFGIMLKLSSKTPRLNTLCRVNVSEEPMVVASPV